MEVHGIFPSTTEPIVVDKAIRVFDRDSGLCVVDDKEGKPAVSSFLLLWSDPGRNVSVVKCFPRTGRTHQLRVHLLHLGHPIVGDPLYSNDMFLCFFCVGDSDVFFSDSDSCRYSSSALEGKLGERILDSDGRTQADYDAQGTGEFCDVCNTPILVDPSESQLRLYLHALRYHCSEFDFATPLPNWAQKQ